MQHSPFGHAHSHGDCYATWYAKKKSAELVGHYNFNSSDREDIEQSLLFSLMDHWPDYQSDKSSPRAFIAWVIKISIAKIVRNRLQEMKFEPTVPVHVEQLLADQELRESRAEIDDETHTINLKLDIHVIKEKLPADLREIAELLQSHSVTEITQLTGKSRQAIRIAIRQIRKVFEEAGFEHVGAY